MCRIKHTAKITLSIFLYFSTGLHPALAKNIIIILDKAAPAYTEIANQLTDKLKKYGDIKIHRLNDKSLTNYASNLTITLGYDSTKKVIDLKDKDPILSVLSSKRDYKKLQMEASKNNVAFTALLIDQPLLRQIRLAKKLIPHLQQIGILYSNVSDISELQRFPTVIGASLNLQKVDDNASALKLGRELLYKVDAIIASSDNQIYNKHNLHGILLSAYRNRVPIIGYSRQMVAAGALLTAYTPVELLVPQLVNMVELALSTSNRHNKLSYHYPKQFRVAVNYDIARALGITINPDGLDINTYNSVEEIK